MNTEYALLTFGILFSPLQVTCKYARQVLRKLFEHSLNEKNVSLVSWQNFHFQLLRHIHCPSLKPKRKCHFYLFWQVSAVKSFEIDQALVGNCIYSFAGFDKLSLSPLLAIMLRNNKSSVIGAKILWADNKTVLKTPKNK